MSQLISCLDISALADVCLEKNVWTASLVLSMYVAFVTCCRRVQLLSRLEHSLKTVTLMVWLVHK